jgi:peptidoglycan/LPS O-acetylase OafA/YrhL
MNQPPPILSTTAAPRYHGLDGLRAAMMLLGIYLHAAVAYATIGGWPYKQAELTPTLNLTIVLIHLFRMPAFYMMAGFFAALLYARWGFRATAANRLRRIALPFVVGWLIVYPLVVALIVFGKGGWSATVASLPPAPWWTRLHPMHLWFLEYLLLLYGLAVVAVPAVRALPAGWRAGCERGFRALVASGWAPLALAVPSCLALLPMRYAGFDDPAGFVPQPHILIAYAIPFAVGWLLYRSADLLEVLRRWAWLYTALAVVAVALYVGVNFNLPNRGLTFVAKCAAHSLALWLILFGITGLFLRHLAGPSAVWRYLCDSSYFLYIAHMPVMMVFQLALVPLAVPPVAKVALVLVATTASLLVMYHCLVRPTAIGAVLNGRRYPIRAAAAAPATA